MTSEADSKALPARRIPLLHGVLAVLAGYLLAQLVAGMTADMAAAMRGSAAAPGGGLQVEQVLPSMLSSQLVLLLVALATPLALRLPLRASLDLRRQSPLVFVAAAVGTVMLGPLGDTLMTELARRFPEWTLGVVPALHDLAARAPMVLLWPCFALIPGVAEELMFRGLLQGALGRSALAVVLTGSAFAISHIDPVHVVGVLPLGIFLSWVAQRSSTLVTIFAHVSNNTLAVFSIQSTVMDVGYGTGRRLPLAWLIESLVLFALSVVVIVHATRRPPSVAPEPETGA